MSMYDVSIVAAAAAGAVPSLQWSYGIRRNRRHWGCLQLHCRASTFRARLFDRLPYVVVLVELDEQPGLRLPSRIIGAPIDSIHVGLRVRAELVPLAGGDFTIPIFRAELATV